MRDKERDLHRRWKTTRNMWLRKERNLPALLTFTHIPLLRFFPQWLQPHIYGSAFLYIFNSFLSIYPHLPISLCLLIEAGSLPRFSAAKRKAIVLSIKMRITVCFVSLYHLLLLSDALVGHFHSFILHIKSTITIALSASLSLLAAYHDHFIG